MGEGQASQKHKHVTCQLNSIKHKRQILISTCVLLVKVVVLSLESQGEVGIQT